MAATLTLQKPKDECDGIQLMAHLERIGLGCDRGGAEISTLAVTSFEDAGAVAPTQARPVPPSERLLFDTAGHQAISGRPHGAPPRRGR